MKVPFRDIFRYGAAEIVAVQGKPYIFTNMRVDRKTIPEGFVAYEVADGDGDGNFWRVQKFVMVNHWATIIGLEPIELGEDGVFWCEPDDELPACSREGCFADELAESPADFKEKYAALKEWAKEYL